jgi:hypothetical protein
MRKLKPEKISDASLIAGVRRERGARASKKADCPAQESRWVTGPTLRKMLNISPVTLWRWRHSKRSRFPVAKSINGRLYFYWPDVQSWLDKQPIAA